MNLETYAEYLQQLPKENKEKSMVVVKKLSVLTKKLVPKTFKTKAKR